MYVFFRSIKTLAQPPLPPKKGGKQTDKKKKKRKPRKIQIYFILTSQKKSQLTECS